MGGYSLRKECAGFFREFHKDLRADRVMAVTSDASSQKNQRIQTMVPSFHLIHKIKVKILGICFAKRESSNIAVDVIIIKSV